MSLSVRTLAVAALMVMRRSCAGVVFLRCDVVMDAVVVVLVCFEVGDVEFLAIVIRICFFFLLW